MSRTPQYISTSSRKISVMMIIVCMLLLSSLILPDNSEAIGLGGYIANASGSGTNDDGDESFDVDIDRNGFGFTLDSNLSKNKIFNYRLKLGIEEWDDVPGYTDGESFIIDNTFGFGIVKKPSFRLWLGPQLSLSYSNTSTPVSDGSYTYKEDTDFIGIGLGIVLGANFNLGPVVTIAPEIGVKYQSHSSDTLETTYSSNGNTYTDSYDASFDEVVTFVNLAIFFRMGEH